MASRENHAVWAKKGATLSDKTAQKEFGLSQGEIIEAIKDGKLQYRRNTLCGNPRLKLLRHEVEALVNTKYGSDYLQTKNATNELNRANTEIRSLKRKVAQLEQRKAELLAMLNA